MAVHIEDNKLVVITRTENFILINLKMLARIYSMKSILITHNKFLAKHAVKNGTSQLLFKYKHGNNICEHEI